MAHHNFKKEKITFLLTEILRMAGGGDWMMTVICKR